MATAQPTRLPRRGLSEVRVRSGDPTEACEVGTRVYHEHRLTVLGDARSFTMRLQAAALGPITIGWLGYDTEVTIDTPEFVNSYQVNILTGGEMSAYCGPDKLLATPQLGMVYRPDRPTGFTGWRTANPMLAIKIDRRALEHELEQLLHCPINKPIRFPLALDLTERRAADWSRMVGALAAGLANPDALIRQPIMAAPLVHSIMSGLLLSANHDLRSKLDAPAPNLGPTTVRRARAYIEQHADQPLTVPLVAAHVGVSIRSLQQAFQRNLGATPHQMIQHVRLQRAHNDLRRSSSEQTTVAEIAAKWGFPHTGRFAKTYRASYGTPPSETLRLSR